MYAIILMSIYLFLYIEKVHLKKKKKDSTYRNTKCDYKLCINVLTKEPELKA